MKKLTYKEWLENERVDLKIKVEELTIQIEDLKKVLGAYTTLINNAKVVYNSITEKAYRIIRENIIKK